MPNNQPIFVSGTPTLQQLGATFGSAAQSGMTDEQFANLKSMFDNVQAQAQADADRTYSLNKAKLDNEYSIARQQAKTQQQQNDIDREYKQAATVLAQQRLQEDHNQYQQTFGENQRQFDATMGLNQAKLGYDLVGTAAQLAQRPEDYFMAANYARGVAAQPGTATFLDALKNNAHLTGFGAQAGTPTPGSLGGLLGKLGGTGTPGADSYLASIGQIGQAGAGKLGAGALENLTSTERSLLASGLGANGYDTPTFLDQYARSRIGNTGSVRAA